MSRRFPRLSGALIGALALAAGLVTAPSAPAAAAPTAAAATAAPTFTNPVTDSFSDSYADPAVIRGHDGWFYLYATSDPLVEGGPFGIMHIARSLDLVEWEYLGTVFDETQTPAWAAEGALFWAPDVRRIGDRYVMYFTVTDTADKPGGDPAIGVATAPTPAGPWTATDAPVVDSRPAPGSTPEDPRWLGTIDPALLATDDGRLLLYFGGFSGGISVVELAPDGLTAVGEETHVAAAERYEGSYVVERDGWYYLMLSSAGCCAGPTTGYSVFVGRSESPTGPFVDAAGVPLDTSRAGGTQVLVQNGNRWVGPGHHAVVTDLAGQDWMIYHAIDRNEPWLNEPGGINRRPTLIDRLDWIDGWPVVNAGAGPSDGPQPGPVTGSDLGIHSTDPAHGKAFRAVVGRWRAATDRTADGGDIARLDPGRSSRALVVSTTPVRGEQRLELDLRLPEGDTTACVRATGLGGVHVCVDGEARELVLSSWGIGSREVVRAPIPERVDLTSWVALSIEWRRGGTLAQLSESRLGDPVASVRAAGRDVRGLLSIEAADGAAEIDNLSVNDAAELVTERVPDPVAGESTFVEEFDGALDEDWRQERWRDDIVVRDGALHWPLGNDDLAAPEGAGPLLLRDVPAGDWIAQTQLTLDLGTDSIRNFQQAGLIVHVGDDDYLRLGSVAIGTLRTIEFLKEQSGEDRVDRGGHLGGPPAATVWLRVLRTTSATGEQLYRSASSLDGESWRWGATWTLPADADPSVGLYAGGGAEPPIEARFEDFRFLSVG
ncbi:glycosyl hydrolase family 43 [Diaminobutyricimonas aerilata]|uniref:Glycosyl hydrolase family 43 n=1 Tax=Diaminobutyricimonas aerilata TaxID=1162967 RepID=A0A2M9CIG6_9MICO|nr:family 43 glycosylhydrolase [Diaminobutyricimonas aerilata]PJJ71726.1 glycosyl hydrolase family 43 [Diaminobutyricimonas aerilata]